MLSSLTPCTRNPAPCILIWWFLIARFNTQVQIGIVLDILSGNLFPFLVESTIIHPPLCPTHQTTRKRELLSIIATSNSSNTSKRTKSLFPCTKKEGDRTRTRKFEKTNKTFVVNTQPTQNKLMLLHVKNATVKIHTYNKRRCIVKSDPKKNSQR